MMYGNWGYGPRMMGGFVGMGLIGMVIQFLILIGIIYLGFIFFRKMNVSARHPYGHPDAMDILRERYAKGEIDSEEFHRLKEDLLK